MYGVELIIDLHDCGNASIEVDVQGFCEELCELVGMVFDEYFFHPWESLPGEAKNPKTWGVSAVQFIITSNITVHVLPLMRQVHVNLFSCKDFDGIVAANFCENYFKGKAVTKGMVNRL